MKEGEITGAVRRFRQAVHAYGELSRDLEQARRNVEEAAGRYPALGPAQRLFERATRWLEMIGAAVADVPGLAEELEEEQLRLTRLRTLAERHGIEVRYDRS